MYSNNQQVSQFERAPEKLSPVLFAKYRRLSEVSEAIKNITSIPENTSKGFVLPAANFGNDNPYINYSNNEYPEPDKTVESIPPAKPQKEEPIKDFMQDKSFTILDEDRLEEINSEEDRVAAARKYVEAVTRDL